MWLSLCQKSLRVVFLLGGSLALAASLTAGTRELLVNNPFDAQTPYLLVYPDAASNSSREPGVYSVAPDGSFVMVLPGEFLRYGANQGILEHFSMSKYSGRHEIAVISQGKIFLLQQSNTEASNNFADSVIEIGSQGFELTDPFTNEELDIPPITSLNDINIISLEPDQRGQTILISIKDPRALTASSGKQKGLTFAFTLRPKKVGEAWIASQTSRPLLLDSQFRSRDQMLHLLTNGTPALGGSRVISTRVLQAHMKRKANDPHLLRQWRSSLTRALESIEKGLRVSQDSGILPFLDVANGEVVMQKELAASIVQTPYFRAQQFYNPVTGIDALVFPNQLIPGRVAESDGSGRYHIYASSTEQSHFLTQLGDDIYFLAFAGEKESPGQYVQIIKLPFQLSGAPLDALAFFEVQTEHHSQTQTYVVVSGSRDGVSTTEAYELDGEGRTLRLKKHLVLSDRFFDDDELSHRLIVDSRYAEQRAIFDNHTDSIENAASYVKRSAVNVPYLDLSNTDSMSHPTLMYNQAVSKLPVASRVMFYEFNPTGPLTNTSMVGVTNRDDKIIFEYPGELLRFSTRAGVSDYILARRVVALGREEKVVKPTDMKVSVIAVDQRYKGGKTSFSIATILSDFIKPGYRAPDEEDSYPLIFDDEFEYPFDELVNVSIVPSSVSADEVQVFFTFKANLAAGRKGAVYAKTILLRSSVAGVFTPVVETAKLLVESEISAEDLKARIFLSKKHGIHFSVTPSLSQTDHSFKVKCLQTGEEVVVDSSRGRGLKLSPLSKELRDDGDSFSMADTYVTWKKTSASGVAHYLKDRGYEISTTLDGLSAEDAAKIDVTFPGLNRYLEDLTDPGKSPRHDVLLVSKNDKSALMRSMTQLLNLSSNKYWHTAYSASLHFDPLLFQVDKASQEDVVKNLRQAASVSKPSHTVVIADARDIIEVGAPTNGDEDTYTMKLRTGNNAGEEVLPHVAYLFATDGEKIELQHLDAPRAPRGRSLIVATPEEYDVMSKNLQDLHQGDVIPHLSINRNFLSLKWRLWNSKSPNASPEVLDLVGSSASTVEDKILPDLLQTLETAADITVAPKSSVIIVPDSLIEFVNRSVISTWANAPEGSDRHWSQRNPKLRTHRMNFSGRRDGFPDQLEVLEELAAAREHKDQRSVLIVPGSLLASTNESRPQNIPANGRTNRGIDGGFTISDYMEDGNERFPHLLYLLATEGRMISTKEFVDLDPTKKTMSVVIVASQSQWATIQNDTTFEQRFNIKAHFSEVRLEQPTLKMKLALINEIFESTRGKMMNLSFELDDPAANRLLSPAEKQEKLLMYLVSRVDSLSNQHGKEPIAAFLKVLSQIRRTVVEDPTIRTERRLDKKSIERMLSKSFGIPMNLNILPPNDPLIMLSNEEKAVRSLQQAGYEGPAEIKLKYIRAILSQTRTVTGARNIPSSAIFFGESSNGKTFLWETFVAMQKLPKYNFDASKPSDNFDAEAMLVNFQLIKGSDGERGKSANQKMTAAEMISHIERFLIGPRGYRGHILLDDVHKAPPKERWELLSYIQYLFDAPGGIARIKDDQGIYHEISVRNLNLAMTINPPENPKVLASLGPNPTMEQLIVAQLAAENCPFDISALKRWNVIINFNKFPVSAKAPKLRDTLVDSSRDEFNVSGKLTVVSPQTIRDVVGAFGTTNAREFLGEATGRLLSLGNSAEVTGPGLELVLPKRMLGMRVSPRRTNTLEGSSQDDREADKLARFITDNMVAMRISSSSPEMKPYLLPLFLDAFRTSLHETLIGSIVADERFVQRSDILLTPFLHAASSNLLTKPALSLKDIRFDPADFGVRPGDPRYANLINLIENIDRQFGDFFPIKFTDESEDRRAFDAFVNHASMPVVAKSRLMIVNETVARLSDILKGYLAVMMRVDRLGDLPGPTQWLQDLEDNEPRTSIKDIGHELVEAYLQFFEEMGSPLLYENQHVERYGAASSFDLARLFLLSMDKAATGMPWGKSIDFMLKNVEAAARESDLGQLPGTQFYFFKSKSAIVRPAVHDAVAQLAEGSDAYKLWSTEEASRQNMKFNASCAGLFATDVQ